jgi:hypothetical protein
MTALRCQQPRKARGRAQLRSIMYKTESKARGACVELVDSALKELFNPGISADRLYRLYTLFGPDPFIVGGDPASDFSAWDYAKRRCAEIEAL